MNNISNKERFRKIMLRSNMIVSEFFSKWKHFSFSYAIFSSAWWLGWYISPFKKICYWGFLKKSQYMLKYFNTHFEESIQKYKNIQTQTTTICTQYRIWVFWAQGENNMPELVHICYQNAKKLHGDSLILITNDNISEYVEIPNYIYDKLKQGIISYTHFSDILRVSLLAKYGGIWIDATCWLACKIPNYILTLDIISSNTKNVTQIPLWSNSRWCAWGIGTNKIKHPYFVFITEMLYKYWEKENYLIDYQLIDFLLYLGYSIIPTAKKSIDLLPEINPDRNKLWNLLNLPYDMEQYKAITQNTWLFKLSYKSSLQKTINGKTTYFGYLNNISNGQQ